MVLWENSPKKEGAYPKREIHTDRIQKRTQIAYNRLQQSDIDCKAYELDYKRLQKSDIDFKILLIPLLTKVVVSAFWEYKSCSVCFLRLQKFVVHFSDIQFGVSLPMERFMGAWVKNWIELTSC